MKYIWLITAGLSLIAGVHRNITLGIKESYIFYIFVIVSLLMYYIRREMTGNEKNK